MRVFGFLSFAVGLVVMQVTLWRFLIMNQRRPDGPARSRALAHARAGALVGGVGLAIYGATLLWAER